MTYLILAALAVAGFMLWLNRRLSEKIGRLEQELESYQSVFDNLGKAHDADIDGTRISNADKRVRQKDRFSR